MAATRTTTAALHSIFRFASPYTPSTVTRICSGCSRPFSSSTLVRQSSKRQLQTATVYRPQSLETDFLAPRNAGPPESSIAGGVSRVDRPPAFGQNQATTRQEPAHPSSSAAPAAAEQTTTKPRRKLRPRKAAMHLSVKAVEQLRGLLDQPEPKLIRVGVKNRGCSGLAYHLEYVDKPGAFDETVEQDGVKVLIDSKALFSIIGSEMDWVEDKLNERFVFKNPNITEQCGCGESFSIS